MCYTPKERPHLVLQLFKSKLVEIRPKYSSFSPKNPKTPKPQNPMIVEEEDRSGYRNKFRSVYQRCSTANKFLVDFWCNSYKCVILCVAVRVSTPAPLTTNIFLILLCFSLPSNHLPFLSPFLPLRMACHRGPFHPWLGLPFLVHPCLAVDSVPWPSS